MPQRSPETEARDNLWQLAENVYPGRGIVQGLDHVGKRAVQMYWLQGRSEGSRKRILAQLTDPESATNSPMVRTEYPGVIPEGTNTDLTVYNALRSFEDKHVVSNGNQTDAVIATLEAGGSFEDGLAAQTYEPDDPNFTPRITGLVDTSGANPEAVLSIIRRDAQTNLALRALHPYKLVPGFGQTVHTYLGNGNPLPSFDTAPYTLPLRGDIDDMAAEYWETLDSNNRVSLVLKTVDLQSKQEDYRIVNAYREPEEK